MILFKWLFCWPFGHAWMFESTQTMMKRSVRERCVVCGTSTAWKDVGGGADSMIRDAYVPGVLRELRR